MIRQCGSKKKISSVEGIQCLSSSEYLCFFFPSLFSLLLSIASALEKKLALDLHAAAIGVSASQHARGQCVKHQWTTLTYYSPLDARDTFFCSMGAMGAMDMGH